MTEEEKKQFKEAMKNSIIEIYDANEIHNPNRKPIAIIWGDYIFRSEEISHEVH